MTLLQRDRENIELGREEGLEEGEKKMAALTKLLLKEGRTEDLEQALEDSEYRVKLYKEYDV